MPNPLYKKLGLKDGQKVNLVNIPTNYFDLLEHVPDVEEVEEGELADFVHIFESSLTKLEIAFSDNVARLQTGAMIWISWPKKTSNMPTDIDYHSAKLVATQNGFVDVKVSAIDETWTACKYMIPKKRT